MVPHGRRGASEKRRNDNGTDEPKVNQGTKSISWTTQAARFIAAGVAAFAFGAQAVSTPPGTIISNQATGTGNIGAATLTPTSNAVQATVGTLAPVNYSAVLATNSANIALPRQTILVPHTLRNTGLLSDT